MRTQTSKAVVAVCVVVAGALAACGAESRATLATLLDDGDVRMRVFRGSRTFDPDGAWHLDLEFASCPSFAGDASLNGEPLELIQHGGRIIQGAPPAPGCNDPIWRIPNDRQTRALEEIRISDGTAELRMEFADVEAERTAILLPSGSSELHWGEPARLAWSPPEDTVDVQYARLDLDGGETVDLLPGRSESNPLKFDGGIIELDVPEGGAPDIGGTLVLFVQPRAVVSCAPEGVWCIVELDRWSHHFPVTVH